MKKLCIVIIFIVVSLGCTAPKKSDETTCRNYRQFRTAAVISSEHMINELGYRLSVFSADFVSREERARPVLERATHIMAQVRKMDSSVKTIMQLLVVHGGGFDKKMNDVRRYNEQGIAYGMLVQRNNHRRLATELKNMIENTRDTILAYGSIRKEELDTVICERTKPDLKNELCWEEARFPRDIPLGGALAVLAGIRLEMANAGSMAINTLIGRFEMPAGCVIDRYDVEAYPHKQVVKVGEEYVAVIMLPDSDFGAPYEMYVDGKKIDVVSGVGFYRVKQQKVGVYKWRGLIQVKMADGMTKEYTTTTQTYTVGR